MRGTKPLNIPVIVIPIRDQCPNADDRVVDVLREFLAQFRSNFVVSLSVMTFAAA